MIKVRELVKRIEAFAGFRVERVETNKHHKFFLDTPTGKRLLVVSATCSDRRGWKNNETLLRRWGATKEIQHG